MALTLHGGFGPDLIHAETWSAGATPSGYSVVTTPAPTQGLGRFKAVNPAAIWSLNWTGENSFTVQPYTWQVLTFRADGTFSSGTDFGIIRLEGNGTGTDPIGLYGIGQANGRYKVALVDNAGTTIHATSTNDYASAADITIRVQWDGTNCKIWIDGVLEITHATTVKPQAGNCILWWHSGNMATVTKYWSGFVCVTSDTEADRPGTDLRRYRLDPNANTSDNGWGQPLACASANGRFEEWDDYAAGGAPDSGTTFNCKDAGIASHVSGLTTATAVGTILGAIGHSWQRTNVANKAALLTPKIAYAGASVLGASQVQTTAWVSHMMVQATVPGGGAWSQTVIDGLEYGTRRSDSEVADAEVSAIAVEVFAIDADPPPAATDRRRFVQLV